MLEQVEGARLQLGGHAQAEERIAPELFAGEPGAPDIADGNAREGGREGSAIETGVLEHPRKRHVRAVRHER